MRSSDLELDFLSLLGEFYTPGLEALQKLKKLTKGWIICPYVNVACGILMLPNFYMGWGIPVSVSDVEFSTGVLLYLPFMLEYGLRWL